MTKPLDQLSDDEIANMTAEDFASLAAADENADPNPAPANNDEDGNEDADSTVVEQSNANEANSEVVVDEKTEEADKTNQRDASGKFVPKADGKAPTDSEKATTEAAGKVDEGKTKADDGKAEQTAVNYEDQVKALFAPFKANGRDMQVNTVDEARTLMQMGANYNKKMQGIRPHLTTIRTLENAKIGEKELNFLIDLHNGVPEAINKLVKDRGIDPMDLAPEKADSYKPSNHKATDAEVELDAVLHELDGSAGLAKTIEVVTKQWDSESRQFVVGKPALLKVINDHVERGIYDQIAAKVDRERMLGRLNGLTDLEAYRQVGDEMNASGEFATDGGKATTKVQQTPAAQVIEASNPKKADDSKRNAQKRGVAPVKAVVPSGNKLPADFNPLSMSDEDFMKLDLKF